MIGSPVHVIHRVLQTTGLLKKRPCLEEVMPSLSMTTASSLPESSRSVVFLNIKVEGRASLCIAY